MKYRLATSTKALATAIALLIGFLPYANEKALAQETRDHLTREVDAVPGARVAANAHVTGRFDQVAHGGKNMFHGKLASNDRGSEIWFAADEMSFADGYSLRSETLADTPALVVKKLTATAPDHRHAVAVVRLDRNTQDASSTGIDRVLSLLQGSAEFVLFKDALPAIMNAVNGSAANTASARKHGASSLYVEDGPFDLDIYMGIFGCFAAILGWIASLLALIAACGIPEPVEPLACAIAVIAFVAAGAGLVEGCGA